MGWPRATRSGEAQVYEESGEIVERKIAIAGRGKYPQIGKVETSGVSFRISLAFPLTVGSKGRNETARF